MALLENLADYTERIVISFIDPYRKTKIRMRSTGEDFDLSPDSFEVGKYEEFFGWLAREAGKINLDVFTCAETIDLSKYGIKHGKCIDDELVSMITGETVPFKKDPSQRAACGCVLSRDIGINDTCIFGCKYCYAVTDFKKASANLRKHNPKWEALIDIPEEIKLKEKHSDSEAVNGHLKCTSYGQLIVHQFSSTTPA